MGRPRLLFLALVLSCAPLARGADVDYLRDIKPLLKHHCYACHGALKQEAKLRVDTAELHRILDTYGIANGFEIYAGDHVSAVADRMQNHVLPFFARHLAFERGK